MQPLNSDQPVKAQNTRQVVQSTCTVIFVAAYKCVDITVNTLSHRDVFIFFSVCVCVCQHLPITIRICPFTKMGKINGAVYTVTFPQEAHTVA